MDWLSLLPALAFALAALWVIIYLLAAFFNPLRNFLNVGRFFTGLNLLNKKRALAKALLAIKSKNQALALAQLQQVFISRNNPKNITALIDFRLSALDNLLDFLETENLHSQKISHFELLLSEQITILRNYAETQMNLSATRAKHIKEGKKLPLWAEDEFNKKLHNLESSLEKNALSFHEILRVFCAELFSQRKDDSSMLIH